MRTPLHLQNDHSKEADLKRVQLHVYMSGLTGGRGFRQTSRKSAPTRIERIGTGAFA